MRIRITLAVTLFPAIAIAAAPDTGWGAIVLIGGIVLIAVLTLFSAAIGAAIFTGQKNSGRKIAAVASIPILSLLVLPGLHSTAVRWSHQLLESYWINASATYVASLCSSTLSKPLVMQPDKELGLMITSSPPANLVLNNSANTNTDNLLVRGLIRFAYGDYARDLNATRFTKPLTEDPFYNRTTSWIQFQRPKVVDYFETQAPESLTRTAPRTYWENHEESIPTGYLPIGIPITRYHSDSSVVMALKVSNATSTHILNVSDTSTLADREHWVARVHATLTNRASGKVDAEYRGFVPLLPSISAKTDSVKTCSSRNMRTVRGAGIYWRDYVLSELITRQ